MIFLEKQIRSILEKISSVEQILICRITSSSMHSSLPSPPNPFCWGGKIRQGDECQGREGNSEC